MKITFTVMRTDMGSTFQLALVVWTTEAPVAEVLVVVYEDVAFAGGVPYMPALSDPTRLGRARTCWEVEWGGTLQDVGNAVSIAATSSERRWSDLGAVLLGMFADFDEVRLCMPRCVQNLMIDQQWVRFIVRG